MAKISTKQVAEAIYASVKDKSGTGMEHALKNAVEFLAKKNLLSKSSEILKYIERFSDKDHNIVRARVSSRNPLSKIATETVENLLKKRHKAKDAVLEWKEDKTVIRGMIIETEEEILDLSMKNRLNQLQTYLINS